MKSENEEGEPFCCLQHMTRLQSLKLGGSKVLWNVGPTATLRSITTQEETWFPVVTSTTSTCPPKKRNNLIKYLLRSDKSIRKQI